MAKTFTGPDGKSRCSWCSATPEYMAYHDQEWGFPVGDDHRLFEKLCLEGFQSGLSWRTILAKRAKEMIRSDGSLAAYFWGFEQQPDQGLRISKDLKKRGWKFVGPTTVHSFLQAMGLVNEHVEDCVIRRKAERERKAFRRPAR